MLNKNKTKNLIANQLNKIKNTDNREKDIIQMSKISVLCMKKLEKQINFSKVVRIIIISNRTPILIIVITTLILK